MPTRLSCFVPCHDGEYGAVVSRYHKIDGYDWLAIPWSAISMPSIRRTRFPRLWTGNRSPRCATPTREHLLKLAPDNKKGAAPKGEWTELVGSSYDRTIHGFQIDSTAAQDQRFIDTFNDRRNVGHFNLLFHNCADFSRVVLDIYMPHAIHRNFIAGRGD